MRRPFSSLATLRIRRSVVFQQRLLERAALLVELGETRRTELDRLAVRDPRLERRDISDYIRELGAQVPDAKLHRAAMGRRAIARRAAPSANDADAAHNAEHQLHRIFEPWEGVSALVLRAFSQLKKAAP
jgi:hypothetical protein